MNMFLNRSTCEHCDKRFSPTRRNQKYCPPNCQQLACNKRWRNKKRLNEVVEVQYWGRMHANSSTNAIEELGRVLRHVKAA